MILTTIARAALSIPFREKRMKAILNEPQPSSLPKPIQQISIDSVQVNGASRVSDGQLVPATHSPPFPAQPETPFLRSFV